MRRALITLACLALSALPLSARAKGNPDAETTYILTDAAVIEGISFPARTALVYKKGIDTPYLARAVLGGDGAPCGVPSPRGATLSFDRATRVLASIDYDEEGWLMTYPLAETRRIDGALLEKGTDVTVRCRGDFGVDESGGPKKLYRGTLAAAYTRGGYTFPQRSILSWYLTARGGGVALAWLPEEYTLGAFPLPAKTRVDFYPDGVIQRIRTTGEAAGPLELQGVTCAIRYSPVELYPNGKLKECALLREQWVDGLFVGNLTRGYDDGKILFYETGRLKAAHLSREHEVAGLFVDGDIGFYESGALAFASSTRKQEIAGYSFQGMFSLYESGKLNGARPPEALEVDGLFVRDFVLYESGRLAFGDIPLGEQERGGIRFYRGEHELASYVEFYETGVLRRAYLPAQKLGGFFIRGSVELYETGALKSGHLERDQKINGLRIKKGSFLKLSPEGALLPDSALALSRAEEKKLPAESYIRESGYKPTRVILLKPVEAPGE
jgi:hypothetical protein